MKGELETLSDILTEFQLVKVLLTGASGEPGLLQRVEAVKPVIENLKNILDEIRKVSEVDVEVVADLSKRLDSVINRVNAFEKIIKAELNEFGDSLQERLINTFDDAMFSEISTNLVIHTSRKIASDSATRAIQYESGKIAEALAKTLREISSKVFNAEYCSIPDLQAQNSALKKQLAAAKQQQDERIVGAMKYMLIAAFGGLLVGGGATFLALTLKITT